MTLTIKNDDKINDDDCVIIGALVGSFQCLNVKNVQNRFT